MKTIQITIDPKLLDEIDNDDACNKMGRSAFIRQAAIHYLKQKRQEIISKKYRSGYGKMDKKHKDLSVWEKEQVWPPT